MKKVKTRWEARWKTYDGYGSVGEERKAKFDNEAECKAFAIQQALENGHTNNSDYYTTVEVYTVETHEEECGVYSRDSVTKMLVSPVLPATPVPVHTKPIENWVSPEDPLNPTATTLEDFKPLPADLDDEIPF